MNILGYSERGILNSLFYEIMFSGWGENLLGNMLSRVTFPFLQDQVYPFNISDARILIEQSFSDFGDADALILINNNGKNQAVFVEAKVKTYQRKEWDVYREFGKLKDCIKMQGKISSSNLFIQLYHKVRLVKAIQDSNIGVEGLLRGKRIKFPSWSMKEERWVGENPVVKKAVKMLGQFCAEVFFVAVLPGNRREINDFWLDELKNFLTEGWNQDDMKRWGFISWGDVENFCRDEKLRGTIKNFEHNASQIYKRNLSGK